MNIDSAKNMQASNSNNRKSLIVDRGFQIKYAFMLASMGFIVSAMICLVILHYVRENYRLLQGFQILTNPTLMENLSNELHLLTIYLIVCSLFLTIFLFLAGLLMSHRLAGPIFKLKRYLNEVARGNYEHRLSLRRNDEYQDLVPIYNHMVEEINKREKLRWETMVEVLKTETPQFEKIIDKIKRQTNQKISGPN